MGAGGGGGGGGVNFQDLKIIKTLSAILFSSTKLIFCAISNHYEDPLLTKF